MKLGTETGSLMNHVYASAVSPAPEVGMGATILYWTDRRAATIVRVTPTQVHVQEDRAIRADDNGMSDAQAYRYEQQLDAPVKVFRRNKRGQYKNSGCSLLIGVRRAYHDYSF